MKKLVIALMLPAAVAAGECVLQSKTATNGRAQILEKSAITQTVTPEINGKKRCIVSFRARIGNQWLTAHGDQSFDLSLIGIFKRFGVRNIFFWNTFVNFYI